MGGQSEMGGASTMQGGGQTNALPPAQGGMNPGLAAMFMGGAQGGQQPGQTLPQIMQPQQSPMPEIGQMMQNMAQQGTGQMSTQPQQPQYMGGMTGSGEPAYGSQNGNPAHGLPLSQGGLPQRPRPGQGMGQSSVTTAQPPAQPSRAQLLARQMNQAAVSRR